MAQKAPFFAGSTTWRRSEVTTKTPLFETPFMWSFHQDMLGANIGKAALKEETAFLTGEFGMPRGAFSAPGTPRAGGRPKQQQQQQQQQQGGGGGGGGGGRARSLSQQQRQRKPQPPAVSSGRRLRDPVDPDGVRCEKRHFLRHFYITTIMLPRPARDKHRKR
jgi:hypothetical protein